MGELVFSGLEPGTYDVTFISQGTDPANLRNLAPDHTLILVNGKRHPRAAVITWLGNGIADGLQGPDLSVIPSIAIRQAGVLRDGAAAQYGSDAIAGVMNFQLKDAREGGSLELRSGAFMDANPGSTSTCGSGNFGHLFDNGMQFYGHTNYAQRKVTGRFKIGAGEADQFVFDTVNAAPGHDMPTPFNLVLYRQDGLNLNFDVSYPNQRGDHCAKPDRHRHSGRGRRSPCRDRRECCGGGRSCGHVYMDGGVGGRRHPGRHRHAPARRKPSCSARRDLPGRRRQDSGHLVSQRVGGHDPEHHGGRDSRRSVLHAS